MASHPLFSSLITLPIDRQLPPQTILSFPQLRSALDFLPDLFLSPSPHQHVIVSALQLAFLLAVAVVGITRFLTRNSARPSSNQANVAGRVYIHKIGFFMLAAIVIGSVCSLCYLGLALSQTVVAVRRGGVAYHELLLSITQTLVWMAFVVILIHEKKLRTSMHSPLLRTWWLLNSVLSLWLCVTGICVLARGQDEAMQFWLDSIIEIVTFPGSLYFLVAAVFGHTGIAYRGTNMNEEAPLLPKVSLKVHLEDQQDNTVTRFYKANFVARVSFAWLNPLLDLGVQKALEAEDVPQLSPDDRADKVYAKLMQAYYAQTEPRSLRKALLRSFWPQLLFTGCLAFTKVCAVYVGPLLITRFVDYVSGEEAFPYEGLVLVAVLFTAKCIEVTSSHHFNFFSNKLGMVIRSALITTVYRKGLVLSSLGRQSHGTGPIVNYMSVDVQQVADSVIQIHNAWAVPFHALVAMGVLLNVVGVSCFAGLAVMVLFLFVSFMLARLQRKCQGKFMFYKDRRMALTTEVLNSMKIIKLQAWEDTFSAKIEINRNLERHWLSKLIYILAINIFFLWVVPVAVSSVTFTFCILVVGQALTSGVVFTTISTFRILREALRLFPQTLMTITQALNSLDRLQRFLWTEELKTGTVDRSPIEANLAVEVDNGFFTWDPERESPTLHDINVKVTRGDLVCIVGQVGAGKSTLIAALLGEIPKLSGTVRVSGSVAYVSQSSWIQNATIEENILFGKPMDRDKYIETLRVCSLTLDLAQMEFGDQTEIGERGINLSGGQKQRIQLARAVYQGADLYLLDDVFSAVDAHTGSALYQECVKGVLSGKTVLLVTHQVDFLHGADQIWVMRDGEIVQSGKYNELLEAGLDFRDIVNAHNEAMEMVDADDWMEETGEAQSEQLMDVEVTEMSISPSKFAGAKSLERQPSGQLNGGSGVERVATRARLMRRSSSSHGGAKKASAKLIEAEERETGQVGRRVYWLYCTKTLLGLHVFALVVIQACWQGLQLGSDYYLSEATAVGLEKIGFGVFLRVYCGLAFGSACFILLRTLTVAYSGLRTAQSFFLTLLHSIMRAPMSFFDTTPTGRILTRFATDQWNVDVLIPLLMGVNLALIFSTVGVVIVIVQVTWYMVFIIAPLTWLYFRYQAYFLATSRELTRIDSITKAPIIHHFAETVAGFVTIRAFRAQERFKLESLNRVNYNLRMDFHNNASNEWLGYRLELIGTSVLCTSALFMVTLGKDRMASNMVGLSLSYGLSLSAVLYSLVWSTCQLENRMVSVERLYQYSNVPEEAPDVIEDRRPPPEWPTEGTISLRHLDLRYRPETPLVLKGITMRIHGGEKVGVVGRTGSGKSTLILALLRLVEPAGGYVEIDGVDISEIGLKDLRSRLGIIPQDPTLFEGTVRTNIDPPGHHSDADIWHSLEKCQLAEIVRSKESGLDSPVLGNGENWSMGQRQLFCLGRVLLKRNKILMLDEATASVDGQTDAIMQQTIRMEFNNASVITIAHRIATVMDSDKVLVLDSGYVKEFDSPTKLLEDPLSLFGALVRESRARSKGFLTNQEFH